MTLTPSRSKPAQSPATHSQRFTQRSVIDWSKAVNPDWLIVALPTVLSLKNLNVFSSRLLVMALFVAAFGTLAAVAFLRPVASTFKVQPGPLVLLLFASGIVVSRPSGLHNIAVFLAMGVLAFRFCRTVDARRIIVSLIDGIGLFALLNVLGYFAGLRSPSEAWRLAIDATRVIFPLSVSVNLVPAIAAAYVVSAYYVIREPGWRRRAFRAVSFVAAFYILVASDTRMAMGTAVLLLALVMVKPMSARWLAPFMAIFAGLSALVLRPVISATEGYLGWVLSRVSDRSDSYGSLAYLNGRSIIWERSLTYWHESVNHFTEILLGYGAQGFYRSGASQTYSFLMARIFRDPDKTVNMHNSFLEQLFDGGVIGWCCLVFALFWAGMRLFRGYGRLGHYALGAAILMSSLLIGSMTEVFLTPDANILTFWIMLVLVAATCQADTAESEQSQVADAMQVSAD